MEQNSTNVYFRKKKQILYEEMPINKRCFLDSKEYFFDFKCILFYFINIKKRNTFHFISIRISTPINQAKLCFKFELIGIVISFLFSK